MDPEYVLSAFGRLYRLVAAPVTNSTGAYINCMYDDAPLVNKEQKMMVLLEATRSGLRCAVP